jgi:putative ABC transport system permease protein
MIKNYLLINFRNLRKHFSYSVINIFGLGLGLATCLLLVTWIKHEVSYDRFHEKSDCIYRLSLEYSFGGQVAATSVSPNALAPAMLTLPETETAVRVYKASGSNPWIVRNGDHVFHENRFYVADSTFFNVFSFALIKGNPKKALSEPYSVILTETTAKKYFKDEEPVGKVLRINNTQDYIVTGVMEDAPSNSLMQFDFLASFHSINAGRTPPTWWSANYQTFVLLHKDADLQAVKEKTNEIVQKEVGSDLSGPNDYVRYNFLALTDIYLKSPYSESEVVSDIRYVYIFSAVALLILVIACINYINLSTARAADRAKEVGIRKVVGALRKQLFVQFISESLLITFFAFVFAFLLAQLLLPLFNELTGKHFAHTILLQPGFILSALGVLTIIAVLAGSYPAFAITAFKPVSVLKGNFKTSGRGIWLRKSLVVFQFSVSIILITGTIIMVKQLEYIQSKNLGYDKSNVIILPLDQKTREVYNGFQIELMRTGSAVKVGRGSESPVFIQGGYSIRLSESNDLPIITRGLLADHEYIPSMGIQVIEGRNFNLDDIDRLNKDTICSFILNESALKAMFLELEQAVGKEVTLNGRSGEIIGVVKDFHFSSLHTDISPLVIFPEDQYNKIFVKLPSGNPLPHIAKIRDVYTAMLPHRPFEFQFLDEQYSALYTNEQRMMTIFIVFATLAIIIACLGLLGLVSFSAAQKTKEIGIRKVLGATPSNIVILITRDFSRLVLVSIVLGIPVGYWMMTQWLSGFAYKTEIGVTPVLIASAICIVIALTTAGYQAVKAALIDPAKTLRNE